MINERLNFAEIIPDIVRRYASNKAMGFVGESSITYASMGKKIYGLMAYFEKLGIKPGDKVIIYSQNMPNWGISYFAMQCMGIITVPALPDFTSHELQNILEHSEAKAILISDNLLYKLKEVKLAKSHLVISINNFSTINKNVEFEYNENIKPKQTYVTDGNSLSILIYTSGTTGNSKGVMLSQRNVIINAYQASKIQPIVDTDRFLSLLPLSHTFENTIGFLLPILFGASISYLRKPPSANVLMPALKKVKPTIMLSVPMIIEKIYKKKILLEIQKKPLTKALYKFQPTRKLLNRVAGKKLYESFGGELKFFGIGGAKLDAQTEQFLLEGRFPYAIGYGLTETAPLIAGSAPFNTKHQAIGKETVYCKLKIDKPDPKTGEGEILAKGPNIMLGYYKNKELTKATFTEDGWFKTGDLGVIDKNGLLSHKGRLKNMIVGANGENIYPEEIESVINNFRHVVESVVVEKKGKLVALVHFDREELELKLKEVASDISQKFDEKLEEVSKKVDDKIEELANDLQRYVNSRVNKFSRIQTLVVHSDPFEKTSTQKIKRFLYY